MSETPPQLTKEHLKGMSPHQIVAARKEGLLDDLMTKAPAPPPEPETEGATPGGADQGAMGAGPPAGTRAWLRWLGPEQVVRLRRAGKLDALMRGDHGHE